MKKSIKYETGKALKFVEEDIYKDGSIICDECCHISKPSDLCDSVCQSCLDDNVNEEEIIQWRLSNEDAY